MIAFEVAELAWIGSQPLEVIFALIGAAVASEAPAFVSGPALKAVSGMNGSRDSTRHG